MIERAGDLRTHAAKLNPVVSIAAAASDGVPLALPIARRVALTYGILRGAFRACSITADDCIPRGIQRDILLLRNILPAGPFEGATSPIIAAGACGRISGRVRWASGSAGGLLRRRRHVGRYTSAIAPAASTPVKTLAVLSIASAIL